MKINFITTLVIISSLLGYLEWGVDQSSFLFQTELEILEKLIKEPSSVVHPLTIIPLAGQIQLLFTLLYKKAPKWMYYVGIFFLAILLVFISITGILTMNWKITLSTLPFLMSATYLIILIRKKQYSN